MPKRFSAVEAIQIILCSFKGPFIPLQGNKTLLLYLTDLLGAFPRASGKNGMATARLATIF